MSANKGKSAGRRREILQMALPTGRINLNVEGGIGRTRDVLQLLNMGLLRQRRAPKHRNPDSTSDGPFGAHIRVSFVELTAPGWRALGLDPPLASPAPESQTPSTGEGT